MKDAAIKQLTEMARRVLAGAAEGANDGAEARAIRTVLGHLKPLTRGRPDLITLLEDVEKALPAQSASGVQG